MSKRLQELIQAATAQGILPLDTPPKKPHGLGR